jgi:S-DNA-T family DNA segregation ATPase FtsK/SpoIIIE
MTKAAARSKSAVHPRRAKPSEARRHQLRFAFGARGREIAGVILIALAILSLLALSGFTPGSLNDSWSNLLYGLFGYGAFVLAVLIGLLGFMIFRLAQGAITQVPWRAIIGLELAFVGLLGVLHAFSVYSDPYAMIGKGEGGGLFGWGLLSVVSPAIPRPWAGMLYSLLIVIGATIALAIPWRFWLATLLARINGLRAGQPTRSAPAASTVPAPVEENVVPPKEVTAKPKQIDQEPVKATQLPLKIVKTEEVKPKKIKRDRALPGLDLLEEHTLQSITDTEIDRKSQLIVETLRQFGLEARVVQVSQGPAVTQYGLEPGYIERPGIDGEVRRIKVRVGQISSLANDLALALAATSLRIEAPVPGQSFVGIEVPNDTIAMVGLRGVLESQAFRKINSLLAFALGRDVSGAAIADDLAGMPHILIAGTTGSGKSVCINAIIMSLIANNVPEDLRLVMIDPKMVELIRYNGLPHLYGKVEFEMERIIGVLKWVTREMDGRYKKFAELGVRHVMEYNQHMIDKGEDKLPYIVVLIDELSDLMMSAPVEIEKTICRIAQMARATGIHLVLATQRPSTDVVTGLIKANFPARISFAVASSVDSRVILDSVGAETLLGRGDMLFLSPTANGPIRVQGCYVSEREIDRMVKFWREKYADEEAEAAPWEVSKAQQLEELAQSSPATAALEDDDEVLLAKAIELVKKHRQASASWLQRKMRLGYPKAAYLIDRMEQMGIVGPVQEAGRSREVLVGPSGDDEEWG